MACLGLSPNLTFGTFSCKSAEKDSFGVEEMESTKSSACENSSLARLVPLPLASSLTPMFPLAELSRPSSGVSSATSSSSLQMDEDGVPYVLSCSGFILGYIDRFWMACEPSCCCRSNRVPTSPAKMPNDLHCNVKVTSMSNKTAPFLTIKTTTTPMPPLNAATPAAAATLTTTASS